GGELNGWAHKDTAVREDAKMLTVKVYKAIGSDVLPFLTSLSTRQMREYRTAFAKEATIGISLPEPESEEGVKSSLPGNFQLTEEEKRESPMKKSPRGREGGGGRGRGRGRGRGAGAGATKSTAPSKSGGSAKKEKITPGKFDNAKKKVSKKEEEEKKKKDDTEEEEEEDEEDDDEEEEEEE
ncbi:hypothetical protein ScalyP_jg255, partial [Parmales sp. scaly parma]